MDRKPTQTEGPTAAQTREARQKAALKANMAKRKAQARARSGHAAQNRADLGPDTKDQKE